MWNHGVPYILKQFIDVVSQPGLVFGFDPELRLHRPVEEQAGRRRLHERGLRPGARARLRQRLPAAYFRDWLRWAGVDDVAEIFFRPNLAIADAEPGRRAAHRQATQIARGFLSPGEPVLLAG